MKIGKLIIEFRRAGGPKLVEEVFDALTDPEGEARAVIAKMARSAAKDFIDAEGGRILADFTAELEKRKAAILAELGSAGTRWKEDPDTGAKYPATPVRSVPFQTSTAPAFRDVISDTTPKEGGK